MNNKNLFIILGVAVVALVATLYFSGGSLNMGEGDDPAMQLAQRSQNTTSSSTRGSQTATTPAEADQAAATPADAEATAADSAEAADDGTGMTEAGDGEAAAESGDEAVEGEDAAADDGQAEMADAGDAAEGDDAGEMAADEGEAAVEATEGEDEAVADDSDLMVEDELPEDPIERFKQMDPRDIIESKYRDLANRQTDPWNEESEWFLPETGRVDPLTRVSSAVPDDLKPPRSGATDENQLQTYLVSEAASQAVQFVAFQLQCHNVIQIGLQEFATFSDGSGRTFTIPEGGSSGMGMNIGGIGIQVQVTVTSIGTDQVIVSIVGTGQNSSTRVSKSQVYIPRAYYH